MCVDRDQSHDNYRGWTVSASPADYYEPANHERHGRLSVLIHDHDDRHGDESHRCESPVWSHVLGKHYFGNTLTGRNVYSYRHRVERMCGHVHQSHDYCRWWWR